MGRPGRESRGRRGLRRLGAPGASRRQRGPGSPPRRLPQAWALARRARPHQAGGDREQASHPPPAIGSRLGQLRPAPLRGAAGAPRGAACPGTQASAIRAGRAWQSAGAPGNRAQLEFYLPGPCLGPHKRCLGPCPGRGPLARFPTSAGRAWGPTSAARAPPRPTARANAPHKRCKPLPGAPQALREPLPGPAPQARPGPGGAPSLAREPASPTARTNAQPHSYANALAL